MKANKTKKSKWQRNDCVNWKLLIKQQKLLILRQVKIILFSLLPCILLLQLQKFLQVIEAMEKLPSIANCFKSRKRHSKNVYSVYATPVLAYGTLTHNEKF